MPLIKSNQHVQLLRKRQSGVGLIEVLLAVVVLSIGFLAAARMQVEGMQANQVALFTSQANFMLRDITDRMRANPKGVADGVYDTMSTITTASLPSCITAETACTPAQLAQADLYSWRSKLYEPAGSLNFVPSLPSSATIAARGEIVLDPLSNAYALTMYWSEFDNDGNPQEQMLRVHFSP